MEKMLVRPSRPHINQTAHIVEQENEIECRRCRSKFETKQVVMDHYTENHTSHIVCRNKLKDNCNRSKCWYRHSNFNTNQTIPPVNSVPTKQDFPPAPPPQRPPALNQSSAQLPVQTQVQGSTTVQQMLAQMAMRMNTLELGISESRNQMHMLQEILSKSQL